MFPLKSVYFVIRFILGNQVHGAKPEDVLKDEEGLQTMRTLADNMAYLLRCIEAGKATGITVPEREEFRRTNFIR